MSDIVIAGSTKVLTQKIHILARSSKPVFLEELEGTVVHDFSTMNSKSKIVLDYNHEASDVIGYSVIDSIDNEGLWLNGVLTGGSEKSVEVINNLRNEIPYEASISHDNDFDLYFAPAGTEVTVNSLNVGGPVYIIANWNLRGVAVCPYGQDKLTKVDLYKDNVNMKIDKKINLIEAGKNLYNIKGIINMAEEVKPIEKAAPPVVVPVVQDKPEADSVVEGEKQIESQPTEEADKPSETEVVKEAVATACKNIETFMVSEFEKILTSFGVDMAAKSVTNKWSFDQAKIEHERNEIQSLKTNYEKLVKENEELKKLSKASIDFSIAEPANKQKKSIFNKI